MKRVAVLLLVLGLSCGGDREQVFYVAPHGDDTNTGSSGEPFATLERARDAASGGAVICQRGGTHYLPRTLVLTAEDSGITIEAYEDEQPVLSGGLRLEGMWQRHAGNVMVCSLNEKADFDELFVNGERQPRARYPNDGYLAGLSAEEWPHRRIRFDRAAFAGKKWSSAQAVLHTFAQNYWGNLQWHIREVDWERSEFVLGEGGWQINDLFQLRSATGVGPRSNYFVDNVFEELDAPGEWYLDGRAGLLYYYPPEGVDVDEAVFEASRLQTLVALRGTKDNPVRNVRLRGVRLAHTSPVYLEPYETPSLGDWTIHRSGAVLIDGAEDCAVEFCDFDAVGGNGVFVSNHARRIRVYGNRFIGAGESAVCLVGKSHLNRDKRYRCPHCKNEHWWGWDEPTGEHPEECLVSNNLIRDIGHYGKQIAGVFLSITAKNTVSHNRISNVPRAAICINDGFLGGHTVEFNDVFRTVLETGDHGPFNSWGRERAWCRYQSHPGQQTPEGMTRTVEGEPHHEAGDYLADAVHTTHIRNNRFRDNRGWGIDLDDGSSNYHVYRNLCIGVSVKLREGDYRQVYNNIFLNPANPPSLHVGYENNSDEFTRNIVVVSEKYYSPEVDIDFKPEQSAGAVVDLIRPPKNHPWLRKIDQNVYISDSGAFRATVRTGGGERVAYTLEEWRELGYDRSSVFADPMFVDPAGDDFRVLPDSPAIALGFENFTLNEVGLLQDFPEAWRE